MATAPESCVVQGISSAPANGQLIEHDSVTYKTVQEGQAFILTPQPKDTKDLKDKKAKKSEDKPQSVFYNPIQQFNRDLSVLAIRAYGEHV
ncbi:RNA methyltransferase tRNA(m5U54)methyltransferase, partial [Ascosphaera atra]